MLRRAARGGTSLIVATPHGGDRGRWSDVESLHRLCHDLNAALETEQLPLTLVLGMENPLEPDTVAQVERGTALSINRSEYILVELPFLQLPLYWEEVLFQLQLRGLRPIIAHPERQAQIQQKPGLLADVVGRGVLTQVTAGSLVGHFGPRVRKVAEKLFKDGLVHVVASDCHAPDGPRSPDLQEGFRAATKLVDQEFATQITSEVPWSISRGDSSLRGTVDRR